MLKVFITVDVEIWCDGWENIDKKFPDAFRHYIYGKTNNGDYGLPFQLKMLQDRNLKAVFFVEPLFAARFGAGPLQEIVGLISEYKQDIQMHMHPEWVNEARDPLLLNSHTKRQHMKYYTLEEQTELIKIGKKMLENAGASNICAFRAGGFGANNDTLKALSQNHISIDSSYNYTMLGGNCEIHSDRLLNQPCRLEGLYEYPMTFYRDKTNSHRHVQLGSCSISELKYLIDESIQRKLSSLVMLSHGFELLSRDGRKSDNVVINRFEKLCDYLESNRNEVETTIFSDMDTTLETSVSDTVIESNLWRTSMRVLEQVARRVMY